MNKPIELNQSLSEQTRQAYLSAMKVEQWIPISDIHSIEKAAENQTESVVLIENHTSEASVDDKPNSSVEALSLSEEKAASRNELEAMGSHEASVDAEEAPLAIKSSGQGAEKKDISNLTSDNKSNHFLKQVNWSNRVLSEETAKSLMIVCRHQVDQPANSFARTNSPSQFMMDYINALNYFCANENFELKIQLAHLSAAGLSEESVPLSQAVEKTNPKMMLLLGDETVSHLLGASMDVASCRGQVQTLVGGTHALVSYHPFSLIKNPSLKRLAFEDIALATEFLAGDD